MTEQQILDEIKSHLQDYLEAKGINTRKPFSCLSPEHEDNDPSMSYKDNSVKCFSCGKKYDVIDLIQMDYNLDFKQAVEKAKQLFNISNNFKTKSKQKSTLPIQAKEQKEDLTEYLKTCRSNLDKTNYFSERGLSKNTIERFSCGYDIKTKHVVIPTSTESYNTRNTKKDCLKKDRFRKKGSNHYLNIDTITTSDVVFITEGEIDAMSLVECGGEAVSLGGMENYKAFVETVTKQKPRCYFIIALDNESTAQEVARDCLKLMLEKGLKASIQNLYCDKKDANEALLTDSDKLVRMLAQAKQDVKNVEKKELEIKAKTYAKKYSGLAYIGKFLEYIETDTPITPTGFYNLDDILGEGLREGLYVMGGVCGLGKTTLILQMADQIAIRGQDVLFFSLEQSRYELYSKSISRETFTRADNKQDAKTNRGITTAKYYARYTEQEKNLIRESIKAYSSYIEHSYISEGSKRISDIRATIDTHTKETGTVPVVFIDYLQLLQPEKNSKQTDKQIIDENVTSLKAISREYKTPVVAISSLNRSSYRDGAKIESFKESGGIEYSADVLISLQYAGQDSFRDASEDIKNAKEKDPRLLEAVVLKNRNGRCGKVSFTYYPKFNYYTEQV